MKLVLVLLGCFAIAAAVPQQRGILEDVESIVQGVISKAQSDLDNLMNLVKELSANAQSNVQNIISNAKNSITTAVANVESQINALITKGGSIALCAQKNLGELEGFKDNVGKSIQGCAGNFAGSAATVEQNILSQVASLKESVSELVTIAEECSVNIMEAIGCALTKGQEVQSLVESVVSQATSAIEVARSKASVAIEQIETCAKQAVGEASIQINQYLTSVQQCA